MSTAESTADDGSGFVRGFFGICALVFFSTFVPETRGRTLEEIQADLGSAAAAHQALARDRADRPRERLA